VADLAPGTSPDPPETASPAPKPAAPAPKPVQLLLPLGGTALMYTREHVTITYRCSHGELGRMLARKMVPLPIRVEGQILWFVDEVLAAQAQAIRTLERWRRR
jgi:hypothetical protein